MEAKARIKFETSKHKINDATIRILIIKVVQIKAHSDIQFTVDAISIKFHQLDPAMMDVGQDINRLNQHVHDLIAPLATRGRTLDDSFYTACMKGYQACTIMPFVDYRVRKQKMLNKQSEGLDEARVADQLVTGLQTNMSSSNTRMAGTPPTSWTKQSSTKLEANVHIAGLLLTVFGYATTIWEHTDDMGHYHNNHEGGVQLPSPQHWVLQSQDNCSHNPREMHCTMYNDCSMLAIQANKSTVHQRL